MRLPNKQLVIPSVVVEYAVYGAMVLAMCLILGHGWLARPAGEAKGPRRIRVTARGLGLGFAAGVLWALVAGRIAGEATWLPWIVVAGVLGENHTAWLIDLPLIAATFAGCMLLYLLPWRKWAHATVAPGIGAIAFQGLASVVAVMGKEPQFVYSSGIENMAAIGAMVLTLCWITRHVKGARAVPVEPLTPPPLM